MQRRYSLTHLIIAIVVVLSLVLSMVCVNAQAQIAFSSNRHGAWEIYVMDTNGKNQRRLTNHRHDDYFPSWSPDGGRIVFGSKRDGGFTYEIYVMDADGSNPQRLTNNGHDDYSPSWSPDGKRIVFSSERKGHFETNFEITSEIYVMDADGGNERRLTENRNNDWHPVWSPDGRRIAFSSYKPGNWDGIEIYVMDADGGNERRLTKNLRADDSPSWSSDSERIAFESFRDGNWEIYVMDADGGNQRNITKHGSWDESPAWYAPALAVSPAGKTRTTWGRLKRVDR